MIRSSLGFTLLEILVVFSVIGILTGIGFASFVSYSRKQSLDQAAQDLKTAIDQARFNSVSRVKPSSCGTNVLDIYRLVTCTNATPSDPATPNACVNPNNLYEMYAFCGSYINVASKARASNILTSIAAASSGECGTDRIIRFYTLTGFDINSCRIVLTTTDTPSLSKTLCVDNGGNTNIKEGTTTCP